MDNEIIRDKKRVMTKLTKFCKKFDNIYWASYRFVRDLISPIWYRFFGRKHHIIRTGLTPSCWYDIDTRLLYSNMELVKWFVENDMNVLTEQEYEEEIKRVNEEGSTEHCAFFLAEWANQYEDQKQILNIYTWWLNYKNRLSDIDDALSVLSAYRDGFSSDPDIVTSILNADKNMNKEEKVEFERLTQDYWDKQEELENEETKMLHKVIDLRLRMWS